ncbi:MAG: cellulose synthase operon protein YhjQ/BcsQ [Rubripirellula sp.]
MSDQAFVKAFSRRRPSRGPAPESQVANDQTNENPVAPAESGDVRQVDVEPGSLQLDQSVASTARIWVDPIEDQIARADQAMNEVPQPHIDPSVPSDSTRESGIATSNSVEVKGDFPGERPSPSERIQAEPIDDPNEQPAAPAVDPLQHIHTAYATGYADASILSEMGSPVSQALSDLLGPSVDCPIEQQEAAIPSDHESEQVGSDRSLFTTEDTPVVSPSEDQEESFRDIPGSDRISRSVGHEETPVPESQPEAAFQAPIGEILESENAIPPAPSEMDEVQIAQETYVPSSEGQFDPKTFAPFQAVWEVDVFDVPTPVADLFFEGTLFQQIAERMSEAVGSGLSSVLVTSTKAGEGRSSVAIGIAMAAAAAGIRVALVDADTDDPTLADDLRLDLQYGWVDTVRGGLPIKEVAVHAVEDGVTLIPLMPPSGRNAATAFEVVQLVELLKNKFELVIIDGPTAQSAHLHQCASIVDSAIIVRDLVRTDTLAINEFSYRLRESGVQGVGVVENFV